jgi:hypothetical protein
MNSETGKASIGQIGCLSVVGLILVAYFLGKSVETRAPPPEQRAAQAPAAEVFDPMDMIKATVGPMTLYYASHSARSIPKENWEIGGRYDLDYPGKIKVAEAFRMPRDPDVDVTCSGGERKPKTEEPACFGGKRVKYFERQGRRLCASPDETPPADVRGTLAAKGWNGSIGWMGWGECHMTFARGLLGKKISVDDAVTYASDIADWMGVFMDRRKPDADELAHNRELLRPARRYAGEHGGRD